MGYQRRVHGELSLNTSAEHNPPVNMKFLVLSACLAVSSAALVTYPNGAVVPADTPEVALARAVHLGQLGHVPPVGYAGYPYAAYPYAAGYPHGLVAHPNGAVVPVEPYEVVAARAAHLAAVAAA